jgi:hypothetical protein
MRPSVLILASTLAAALPAAALDVTGTVVDKLGAPIAGAKVCATSDASACVTTGAQGDFHLQKAIAIRPSAADSRGFELAYRHGALTLLAPSAMTARLEWLAPDGRRTWSVSELRLAAGRNAVALPRSLPRAGLCLVRLSTADQVLSWKAVIVSGTPSAGAPASSPRVLALSKAAAFATLEITKSGYQTAHYEVAKETEADVMIYLSAIGDVGLPFGGTAQVKVIAIDRDKKLLITESVEASCDSDVVVHDTTRDTSNYAIRGGYLWTWETGDCTGQAFTGTSNDIVGKWTLGNPDADLPADLKTGCTPDTSGSGQTPFDSYTADYTVTSTQVTSAISVDICPGDLYGPLLALMFTGDSGVTLTKNTCRQLAFKNGNGEDATVDFTKKGDSLLIAFTYKGTVCKSGDSFSFSDADPVCPEPDGGFDEFVGCLAGSGFADLGIMAKASAAVPRPALSVERRFPAWGSLPMTRDPASALRAIRAEAVHAVSIFANDGRRGAR